jgi:hypothetical protein
VNAAKLFPLEVTLTVSTPMRPFPNNRKTQANAEGNSAIFTVNATGSGTLTYQWKKNGVDVGTNSNSLTINNLQVSDNNVK